MAEIRCGFCGWRNEATARVCGGCGRALRSYSATGTSREYVDPSDMPTVEDFPPMRPSARSRVPTVPNDAGWGASPASRAPSGSRGTRIVFGTLAALAGLAILASGVWAAAVRPQLHQQANSALRTQLDAMVATVNELPVIPTASVPVTAAQATGTLQADLPANVPLQNPQVNFSGGRVIVTFTAYGVDGAASTALSTHDGRLIATATEVDGPLSLVESGDELEASINGALGKLRHDVTFQQITLQNGVLTVSVKGNA